MKKIINIFLKILTWLISLGIAVIAIFLTMTVIPGLGGYKVFIVKSGSMEPNIKTGSIIIVKPNQNYQVGDVITFRNGSRKDDAITHRIFAVKEAGFETKGDANNKEDGNLVYTSDIFGKKILAIPYLGYGVTVTKQPIGFIFIIIIPALFLIIDESRKIWLELKKRKK